MGAVHLCPRPGSRLLHHAPLVALILLSCVAPGGHSLQTFAAQQRPWLRNAPASSRSSHLAALAANTAVTEGTSDAEYSERYGNKAPALTLQAPSKINLFLRILRKREDGYHELASLFQAVSLTDTLDFWVECADSSKPICSMEVSPDSVGRAGIPTDETNLVMRALKLFADKTGTKQRVHCRLHKNAPAQAGLGAGSSDAATAMHAATRLAGFPATQQQLIEWSAELGSDISFFFSRGTAYCTGRGEIIENVPPLPDTPCFLVKPADGLSTPAVFKQLGLNKGQALDGPDPRKLLADFQASVKGGTFLNDLEPPAFAVMPKLDKLRMDLKALGFDAVMMSGSGSTIFCIGRPAVAGAAWKEDIVQKHGASIFEVRFCQRSPNEQLWYNEA